MGITNVSRNPVISKGAPATQATPTSTKASSLSDHSLVVAGSPSVVRFK